jgi:hypothetical protein
MEHVRDMYDTFTDLIEILAFAVWRDCGKSVSFKWLKPGEEYRSDGLFVKKKMYGRHRFLSLSAKNCAGTNPAPGTTDIYKSTTLHPGNSMICLHRCSKK